MTPSQGFRVGRILGIPIFIDYSWVIIFGLITFSLSTQFTKEHPQWTNAQTWGVGLATSLLFFGSVVFHELAHSVVAQRYKIRVLSITLFIFGGLARIARDPSSAKQEFNIAIAGPISSGFLAVFFWGISQLFPNQEMIVAGCEQLYVTNGMLALFNLLPGFPLDGGRVFRAMVWGATKDFTRATRAAGMSGKLIAYMLIIYGLGTYLLIFFKLDIGIPVDWGGIWFAFIGWFLLN